MGQEHIMIHQKGGEGGKSREGMRDRWEWGLWMKSGDSHSRMWRDTNSGHP